MGCAGSEAAELALSLIHIYGAMIDSEFLEKGKRYQELPDVYLIYVSETDLWRYGLAAYPVHRCFQNLEHLSLIHI